jgi:hypothetical protein
MLIAQTPSFCSREDSEAIIALQYRDLGALPQPPTYASGC